MIAETATRVERNTPDGINREHQAEIRDSLDYHRARPQEIPARLAELDREWDIERALQANAAAVSLAGLGLAALVDRRLMVIPVAVAGFLMQHAIRGWCPPVPLLRRLGFRTAREICEERSGLQRLIEETPIAVSRVGIATAAAAALAEEVHEGVEA